LGYLLTSGGVPLIQWGDELNILSPDPPLDREPPAMPWEDADACRNDPESTFNLVRKLALLRKQYPELRQDTHKGRHILSWSKRQEDGLALWMRQISPDRFFAAVMLLESDAEETRLEFALPIPFTGEARYRGRDILHPGADSVTARVAGGEVRRFTLPVAKGRGFQLWLFERLAENE
jgi:hypothetical protein